MSNKLKDWVCPICGKRENFYSNDGVAPRCAGRQIAYDSKRFIPTYEHEWITMQLVHRDKKRVQGTFTVDRVDKNTVILIGPDGERYEMYNYDFLEAARGMQIQADLIETRKSTNTCFKVAKDEAIPS